MLYQHHLCFPNESLLLSIFLCIYVCISFIYNHLHLHECIKASEFNPFRWDFMTILFPRSSFHKFIKFFLIMHNGKLGEIYFFWFKIICKLWWDFNIKRILFFLHKGLKQSQLQKKISDSLQDMSIIFNVLLFCTAYLYIHTKRSWQVGSRVY